MNDPMLAIAARYEEAIQLIAYMTGAIRTLHQLSEDGTPVKAASEDMLKRLDTYNRAANLV